eukprot:GHVU01011653.1.p1 GENE.GHVU01011653.1~~GHVU01011653.1.p1  ORF type:complete len:115 (-),score=2.67 GHVU01011653.1:278-622(-)
MPSPESIMLLNGRKDGTGGRYRGNTYLGYANWGQEQPKLSCDSVWPACGACSGIPEPPGWWRGKSSAPRLRNQAPRIFPAFQVFQNTLILCFDVRRQLRKRYMLVISAFLDRAE